MSYLRVIPRDLFNEAKLLKCLGKLSVKIHDGFDFGGRLKMVHLRPNNGFDISQYDSGLFVSNIILTIDDKVACHYSCYNDKGNFPFYIGYSRNEEGDEEEFLVFDESGEYTEEFKSIFNQL